MSRPVKTNPAYASLAYRKSIIQWVSSNLKNRLLGVTGEPTERLMCEDVLPVDAEVPAEELYDYIRGLAEEEAQLDLEMNKFEFTRKADGSKQRHRQGKSSRKALGRPTGQGGGQSN
jgi:hypothetical protein